MAKCNECIEYTRCLLKGDEDALNLTEGVEVCRGFTPKDVCLELIEHIGETIYKICPKCNPHHNESCERCAWRGCMSIQGCDILACGMTVNTLLTNVLLYLKSYIGILFLHFQKN